MKVKEQTQNRLVVENFSWRVGLICLISGVVYGMLLQRDGDPLWQVVLAPVLFALQAWGMSYQTLVVFDRRAGMVHIDEHRLGWHARRSLPLAAIAAVENVEWYSMWCSTWRLELKLRSGEPNVPLLLMFTWHEDQNDTVAVAIAKFLRTQALKRADWRTRWGEK